MAFIEDLFPESGRMIAARQTMSLAAWADALLSILYLMTIVLTLGGGSTWWIPFLQTFHLWTWAFGVCAADLRNGTIAMTFGYSIFTIAALADALALGLRFFLNVYNALTTPWLELILLGETLFMLFSAVTLLTSAQQVLCGMPTHEAKSKREYASTQTLQELGRSVAQAQALFLLELRKKDLVARALTKKAAADKTAQFVAANDDDDDAAAAAAAAADAVATKLDNASTTYTVASGSRADHLFSHLVSESVAANLT